MKSRVRRVFRCAHELRENVADVFLPFFQFFRPYFTPRPVASSLRCAASALSGRNLVRVNLAARSRLILAGAVACRRPSGERPGRRSSRRRKENAGPVAVPGRRLFVNLPRLAISRGVSRLASTCRRFLCATSSASAACASNYASAVLRRLLLSETDPTMSGGAVAC